MRRFAKITPEALRACVGNELQVYVAVALHEGPSGAWPSQETIARLASVSDRTVRRVLSSLEAKGLLERVGFRHGSVRWRIRTSVSDPDTGDRSGRGCPDAEKPDPDICDTGSGHQCPADPDTGVRQTREGTRERTREDQISTLTYEPEARVDPAVTDALQALWEVWRAWGKRVGFQGRIDPLLPHTALLDLVELGASAWTPEQFEECLRVALEMPVENRKRYGLSTMVVFFTRTKGKQQWIARILAREPALFRQWKDGKATPTVEPTRPLTQAEMDEIDARADEANAEALDKLLGEIW